MKRKLKSEQVGDAIIHVDRTVRPVYPKWMKMVMHPELEGTGPVRYDLSTVQRWLHEDQEEEEECEGWIIYEHLKDNKMLERCLGLRDGEEITKKGVRVLHKFFPRKVVLWRSVVKDGDDYLRVPYLSDNGVEAVVYWEHLVNCRRYPPAARFAS